MHGIYTGTLAAVYGSILTRSRAYTRLTILLDGLYFSLTDFPATTSIPRSKHHCHLFSLSQSIPRMISSTASDTKKSA